jgi:hypothetical protein
MKIDRVSEKPTDFDLVNLKTLKNKNICEVGAESLCFQAFHQLKIYTFLTSNLLQIYDKKKQPIELLKVRVANDTDNYLWVRSQAKAMKENSMNDQFSQRFEEGLHAIQNGIVSKGGNKRKDKVWERDKRDRIYISSSKK